MITAKAIDDYYVYDDDSLDASDVRELQRELGVRIDDNVIVACDVTYQNGQDNDFCFRVCPGRRAVVSAVRRG